MAQQRKSGKKSRSDNARLFHSPSGHKVRLLKPGEHESLFARAEELMPRVGTTSKARLEWVLRLTERPLEKMLPGDVENLQFELKLFVSISERGAGLLDFPPPTREELPKILAGMQTLVEAVARRPEKGENRFLAQYEIGSSSQQVFLAWSPSAQRFTEELKVEQASWEDLVMQRVIGLILEHGHLVRECPAPRKGKGQATVCGKRFVANRPRQEYCSSTCRSRATMRAKRAGTQSAATVKRQGRP